MKISELQAIFARASQLLGDAPVILKAAEGDAETFVKGIEVLITSDQATDAGQITLLHTTEPPAPAEPAPAAS